MPHSKNDKHSQYLRRKDFVWRPPKVSRKEREYRVYREEILSAAEKVFAAKGFFPITMSDIAREAEFGTGTPSKLEAVLEIFLGKAQRMERRR